MSNVTVFNYQNPKQFLLDYLTLRQKRDSRFSLRSWSKEMGFKSHTLLHMLLQGKRPLRLKHVPLIARGIGLSSQEQLYLQALVQWDSAQTPEEKQLCSLWLSDISPGGGFKTKVMQEFEVISNWLYTAILAMTQIPSFQGTAGEIHARLGHRVTIHEARGALQRLLDLGLVERDSSGRLKTRYQRITSMDEVGDEGAKRYHETASSLAREAVRKVPLKKREFQSFSIAISKKKEALAKDMIRKFRAQFSKAMAEEAGDEVYQMNIQLFQLTESPAKQAEDEGVDTEKKETHYV